MVRKRRYIKPKLTRTHKKNRLNFVLDQVDRSTQRLPDFLNSAHGDEKWFYMMKDGQICRVFPDRQGQYRFPRSPKIYHKSRMPKVMVLAVCARPRPEYGFDGRIGMWSFTIERLAKRSDRRTGVVAGQTTILEDVTVDASAYRKKIIAKGGVFEAIREKMWWYHKAARYDLDASGCRKPSGELVSGTWRFSRMRGTPCAEAGQSLLYQHDGARPHTAKENHRAFACQSKTKGFSLCVVTQPAQSPDVDVNDLAFFNSLQSDVSLVAKENRQELLAAILDCWREYPAEKMESVWRCLHNSYHGILESGGGNEYPRHRGSRTAHRSDIESCRAVTAEALTAAECALVALSSDVSDCDSSRPEAATSESEESDSD
ncbi:uncharacterized protein LOC135827237 [Sycon ciliatum]|uniref:uncharacterized protein LOC135827237 n=1 Tax=Sycon ciliatum TaxID=27933 RepID=UPI0031F6A774